MVVRAVNGLPALFESDETAWLEAMAGLIGARRLKDLDYTHLGEYLADMARRDRREVESRLAVLIAHLLKWRYQARKRTRSWRATIELQRQELVRQFRSRSLRNHAAGALADVYADAVRLAAAETGIRSSRFPDECPWTLAQLEREDLLAE